MNLKDILSLSLIVFTFCDGYRSFIPRGQYSTDIQAQIFARQPEMIKPNRKWVRKDKRNQTVGLWESRESPLARTIRVARTTQNWTEPLDVAEETLKKTEVSPQMMTTILKIFGESGNLGRALLLLRDMKDWGVTPNERHFGALLHSCRLLSQPDMAWELFQNFVHEFDIDRNTVLFNTMISLNGDFKRGNEISKLLEQMTRENVQKDTFTYSAAMIAFNRCQMEKETIRLWDFLSDSSSKRTKLGSSGEISINAYIVNAALRACSTRRQWKKLFEVVAVADSLSVPLDAVSYSIIILACGELGRANDAIAYFKLAMTKSIKRDTGLYNALATAYEKTGEWELSIKLLDELKADGIRADSKTYNAIIVCCGRAGRLKEALQVFDLMAENKVKKDTVVYNSIIGVLQSAGGKTRPNTVADVGFRMSASPRKANHASISQEFESNGDKLDENLHKALKKVYSMGVNEGVLQHWATIPSVVVVSPQSKRMDLHGFPLAVAKTAVEFVLSEMRNSGKIFDLVIITGRGKHVNSSGSNGVLRKEIMKFLEDMAPQNMLSGQSVNGNEGCIFVSKESINRWMQKHSDERTSK
jgi:pentatricopeptide repeat protein